MEGVDLTSPRPEGGLSRPIPSGRGQVRREGEGPGLDERTPVGEWDDLDPRPGGLLAAYYSGPYPPPSMLREYDAIVPGLAKEIAQSILSQT